MELGRSFQALGMLEALDWHWYPGGTTYHFPGILVDCDLEGIVDLIVQCAPPLGEFWLAPVANQFMDRLLGLTWYDVCT